MCCHTVPGSRLGLGSWMCVLYGHRDCGNVSGDLCDSRGWVIWSSDPGCGNVGWVTGSTDHDCKVGKWC